MNTQLKNISTHISPLKKATRRQPRVRPDIFNIFGILRAAQLIAAARSSVDMNTHIPKLINKQLPTRI